MSKCPEEVPRHEEIFVLFPNVMDEDRPEYWEKRASDTGDLISEGLGETQEED